MDIENIIDQKGLDYISRKVSMYSGDIRRSLTITKRAVELCRDQYLAKKEENEHAKIIPVSFRHATEAFNDLYNSKTVQVLQCLMENEMMVILGLHLELRAQSAERVLMDRVQRKVNYLFN